MIFFLIVMAFRSLNTSKTEFYSSHKFIKKGKIDKVKEILEKSLLIKPEKPYKIVMNFESGSVAKSPYITFDEVSFGYSKQKLLVKDTNLGLEEKTRMTIVGLNGCGKSTLLKLIVGELIPIKGTISRNNNVKVSYFNQSSIEELPSELTPLEYDMISEKSVSLALISEIFEIFENLK